MYCTSRISSVARKPKLPSQGDQTVRSSSGGARSSGPFSCVIVGSTWRSKAPSPFLPWPLPRPAPSRASLPWRGRVRGRAQGQTRTQQFGLCETFLKAEVERDAATRDAPQKVNKRWLQRYIDGTIMSYPKTLLTDDKSTFTLMQTSGTKMYVNLVTGQCQQRMKSRKAVEEENNESSPPLLQDSCHRAAHKLG